MLLVIDIGNSNIVMGTYIGKKLQHHWRISTDRQKTSDEYGLLLEGIFRHHNFGMSDIDAVIISSVVPPLVIPMEKMCERYFHLKPLVVGPGIKTGIKLKYENPREIGADRIVNVVGAYEQYGGPLIVIDMGTATTMVVLDKTGAFIGGCISPGVRISMDALTERTALLPGLQLDQPKRAIGRNTIECMRSGLMMGSAAMLDGMIDRMERELGYPTTVVATGGIARFVVPMCEHEIFYDKDLILKGLAALYRENKRP